MPKEQKKFADDGWAVWVDGEHLSTVYINDWISPKGKSYVDIAVRSRGIKTSRFLHVYVPFSVSKEEIEDVSLLFKDMRTLHAVFSVACIVDYKKNEHTSEIAYNGKTVDIIHMSTLDYELTPVSEGTLININLNEAYDKEIKAINERRIMVYGWKNELKKIQKERNKKRYNGRD